MAMRDRQQEPEPTGDEAVEKFIGIVARIVRRAMAEPALTPAAMSSNRERVTA